MSQVRRIRRSSSPKTARSSNSEAALRKELEDLKVKFEELRQVHNRNVSALHAAVQHLEIRSNATAHVVEDVMNDDVTLVQGTSDGPKIPHWEAYAITALNELKARLSEGAPKQDRLVTGAAPAVPDEDDTIEFGGTNA